MESQARRSQETHQTAKQTHKTLATSDLIQTYATLEYILTIVCVLGVTILLWTLLSKRRSKCVLFVGLSGSGKTAYFTRLVTGKQLKTVTSIKENDISLVARGEKFRLLDLPGNDRIRSKYWDDHREKATKILFFVNTRSFPGINKVQVSEFLYQVLSDKYVNKHRVPVVLVFNKIQPNSASKPLWPPDRPNTDLMMEIIAMNIYHIQETKYLDLPKTSGAADDTCYLGTKDSQFTFDKLKIPFHHVTCSLDYLEDEPGLLEDLVYHPGTLSREYLDKPSTI